MKAMAIDYGDARTGVAFSDPTGSLPGETLVLECYDAEKLADRLCALAGEKGATVLVLGLPRNMDGSEGPRAEKSRALAAVLERRGCTVALQDERRSTVEAHGILNQAGVHGKKRKARIDAVAASLILETYLNARRR